MKRNSNPSWRVKTLVALPLAMVALAAFAAPKAEGAADATKTGGCELVATVPEATPADTLKGKPVSVKPVADGDTVGKVHDVVEEMPRFPGGMRELMAFMRANVNYPAEAAKDSIRGRVIVQFVVDKDGNVVNPVVKRSVHPLLDAEALRVVKAMPKWIPGKKNGQAVSVKFAVPVRFGAPSGRHAGKKGLHKVYYLVDGVHVDDIKNIDPQDIESIEVFKDKKNTVDKYGPAARHGVVSVKMKKK